MTVTRPERNLTSAIETLLQVRAVNKPIMVAGWGMSAKGIDNLQLPVRFHLVKQTDAGTGGASATEVKMSQHISTAIDGVALDDAAAWTVEPASSDVFREEELHLQTSHAEWFPRPEDFVINTGDRIAVRMPDGGPGTTTNGTCWIAWYE
jgi:hypothetical protein